MRETRRFTAAVAAAVEGSGKKAAVVQSDKDQQPKDEDEKAEH